MTNRISLAVTLLACASASAQPQYTLAQIVGPPAGYTLWDAYDLGPQGQVIGRIYNNNVSPPLRRGFVWQNGTMTLLDGPGGETRTVAWCMDDHGVVYGGYDDPRFSPVLTQWHPARWVNGVPEAYSN